MLGWCEKYNNKLLSYSDSFPSLELFLSSLLASKCFCNILSCSSRSVCHAYPPNNRIKSLGLANYNTIWSFNVQNLIDFPGVISDPARVLLILATPVDQSLQNFMYSSRTNRLTNSWKEFFFRCKLEKWHTNIYARGHKWPHSVAWGLRATKI